MKWMGWDEGQLHAAHTSTIAEIVALMQEAAEEAADA